jgi:signal transduction histidine kinase
MKIKNKLTLVFTLIFSVILICLNLYIYFIFRTLTINNFFNQLKDRAVISATVFLEADEQNTTILNSFQDKYLNTLPGEIIRIYDEKNHSAFIDSSNDYSFADKLINEIRAKKEIEKSENGRQIFGNYYQDNQGNFVIIASAIDEQGIKNLGQLKKILLTGFLVSIVIVFFFGRYFTSLMLKPISIITAQSQKISETNLHLRLNEGNKKDELAGLSITINKMLERLESAFDLQKNFVANASHELRTPLTSIMGNIEVTLNKDRTTEDYKSVLTFILNEAEKLHNLTNGLLSLAQSNFDLANLKKEEIRLDETLIEIKNEIVNKRKGSIVILEFSNLPENASSLSVQGDQKLLQIALFNIIDNACKFSNGKEVKVDLQSDKNGIYITVKDQGIGIDKSELPFVTETFFRANNARAYTGSGIGLSLADKIIKLHGGQLAIHSELLKGTSVSIFLPLTNI